MLSKGILKGHCLRVWELSEGIWAISQGALKGKWAHSEGRRSFSEGSGTLFEGHLIFHSSKPTFYGRSIFNADVVLQILTRHLYS